MAATINPLSAGTISSTASSGESARFSLAVGPGRTALLSLVAMCGLLIAAFWEVLYRTALEWSQPQYSHGWIIPLIALYIMWSLRPFGSGVGGNDARSIDLARNIGFGMAGLTVVGKAMGIGLVSGVGLAGACLALLVTCLVGQPYNASSRDEEGVNYTPLWIVTGVGSLFVVVGLLAMFGIRVPGIHPGYLQLIGLLGIMLGGLAVAMTIDLGSKAGVPEMVYGLATVVLSIAAWSYSVQIDMMPLARIAFVTSLFGVFAMVGGLRLIGWAGPSVAFLAFMFPLPSIVERTVLSQLQKVAVLGAEAVYTLIGVQVIREGNKISLQGVSELIHMNVVEACSGLSMSTILVAMAIAMALLVKRPWWDKLVILLSALPIALLANVFRIVATGLIWMVADAMFTMDPEAVGPFRNLLHDNAGMLLMMPFALGMYWLVYKVLTMLTVEEQTLENRAAGVLGRGASTPQ